MDAVNVKKETE